MKRYTLGKQEKDDNRNDYHLQQSFEKVQFF